MVSHIQAHFLEQHIYYGRWLRIEVIVQLSTGKMICETQDHVIKSYLFESYECLNVSVLDLPSTGNLVCWLIFSIYLVKPSHSVSCGRLRPLDKWVLGNKSRMAGGFVGSKTQISQHGTHRGEAVMLHMTSYCADFLFCFNNRKKRNLISHIVPWFIFCHGDNKGTEAQ